MKKTSSSVYTFFRMVGTMVLVIMVMCTSCSKSGDDPVDPLPSPTPPPATPPSGVIDYFVVTDSLMPYYTAGSVLKWLVTGTNAQTVVTINGVKVNFNGILDAGPLKQTSIFTLSVNNGKKATVAIYVADSVTTLLWNKGTKRLKLIKKEFGYYPIGSPDLKYRDTTITDSEADERITFNYDNTSKIYLVKSGFWYDAGKFTMSRDQKSFSWRARIFDIDLLDGLFLRVLFDEIQSNGTKLKLRHTYQYE